MLLAQEVTIGIEGKSIMSGFSIHLVEGTINLLVGPNGKGKSSFVQLLLGNPLYQLHTGSVFFKKKDLFSLAPHERACQGLFIIQQEAVEIPGLGVIDFLKAVADALGKKFGSPDIFVQQIKEIFAKVGLPESFLERSVHEGFSGGQKKRFELAQVLLYEPECIIFDEIDSGLDSEGQRILLEMLHYLREKNPKCTILCITHNPSLFSRYEKLVIHELS